MTSRRVASFLALCIAFTTPSFADEPAEPDSTVVVPIQTIPSIVFPVQEVVGKRVVRIHTTTFDDEDRMSARFSNASEMALEAPGVAGVRRNASQVEPVIRGLGWERVAVQLNHMPVFGACPGRMDPPLTYAAGSGSGEIEIVKGLPSVTNGTAGTGGRVIVSSAFERSDTTIPWNGWLRGGFDAARSGVVGEAGLEGGTDVVELKATAEALNYDDYTSGGGITVPARQSSMGAGLASNVGTGEDARWWSSAGLREESDIDYPSLPMDLVSSSLLTLCTGYQSKGDSAWEVELGYYGIDHKMDNALKSNRQRMEAHTDSDSQGGSALARYDAHWDEGTRLSLGADATLQSRDATRTRTMVAMNRTSYDRLWPDTRQDAVGAFVEFESPFAGNWRMRSGVRVDRVASRANAADDPALGGGTVSEAWQSFYGEGAADYDRDETIAAGNVVVSGLLANAWQLHLGIGLNSRSAGVTERYFAFAPAPGGFMIGNPTLDPEHKWELSAELEHASTRWTGNLALYAHSIDDYILTSTIAVRDLNNDGVDDRLRGFENAEARLYGLDGSARLQIGRGWSVPMQGMYVYAQNTRDDRPLSEIPPAEGRVGLRYDRAGERAWWIVGSSRLVAAQDRIDTGFGEDRTPGFITLDLRTGARLIENLWLDAGILNLLDKDYHEHLTRETLLPTGDLAAGQEVPAPGISAYITLKYEFGG